jgi:hypothetical protein
MFCSYPSEISIESSITLPTPSASAAGLDQGKRKKKEPEGGRSGARGGFGER